MKHVRFCLLQWYILFVASAISKEKKNAVVTLGSDNQKTVRVNRDLSETDVSLPTCKVQLNVTSAKILIQEFEFHQPNFAKLSLSFHGHKVEYTEGTIQPFDWVWTYYSIHGLFSYLKWPADFSILSFGLLDYKTLPDGKILDLEVKNTTKCQLKIGEQESVKSIAEALKTFTQDYIVPTRKIDNVDYSYWCYHAEVPNSQDTILHKLRSYTGFPVHVAAFNCCYTKVDALNKSHMSVECKEKQIFRSFEVMTAPYLMTLIAFAYFPIFLMRFGNKATSKLSQTNAQYRPVGENETISYVYLENTPPISIFEICVTLCGTAEKFPFAVGRFCRLMFVVSSTISIFVRLHFYRKYLYGIAYALIKHKCPLGFMSMLAGFSLSQKTFLTVFGGPYCVLYGFYFLSFFFLILPKRVDKIFEIGSSYPNNRNAKSPLYFSFYEIELFSSTKISTQYGYGKAAGICSGGVYMLMNSLFWKHFLILQYKRFVSLNKLLCLRLNKFFLIVIFTTISPILVVLNLFEICLTIFFYLFPVICFFRIVVIGYTFSLIKWLKSNRGLRCLGKLYIIQALVTVCVSVSLLYLIIGFCAIFTDTFAFLSKMLIFSFLSVIVYPSFSFGYIFFGIVFLYYILKLMSGFGEGYQELLSDVVEASFQLDEDPNTFQLVDSTLIVNGARGCNITKVQILNSVLYLTNTQSLAIREASVHKPSKIRLQDHKAGIPRELFLKIVAMHRPVYKQMFMILLRIGLIFCLIYVTILIVSSKPRGSEAGISEVMHVVFLMAVGALPRIVEIIFTRVNPSVKKDIQIRKLKSIILEYWQQNHNLLED